MSLDEAKLMEARWPSPWDLNTVRDTVSDSGLNVIVLHTLWYPEIIDGLKKSCQKFWESVGFESSDKRLRYHEISGSFEMPLAAQWALEGKLSGQTKPADVVIGLGCIIRGGTPHFEYICKAVADGMMKVQLDLQAPVGFGVLTVNSQQEALDRAQKGWEASQAALSQWLLKSNKGVIDS